MTTFTISETNEIVAFATPEEAAAHSATPFDTFASEQDLAELAMAWPAERLLAVWNSVPGLTPATEIKDVAKAAKVMFKRLEKQSGAPMRETKPKTHKKAKGGAPVAKGAPAKGKPSKKATPAKAAPKAKKGAKAREAGQPREGSKMAQVVALMQRKGGVTLAEMMKATGWQPHSCRGFVAGAMKKAGYSVESFKPEGGERSYRLPK